jgi:hypothetical protein
MLSSFSLSIFAVYLTAILCLPAYAQQSNNASLKGTSFTHEDWVLACDNTLTCRAAGYSSDGADVPATVLITRAAGANILPTIQVQHDPSEAEGDKPAVLVLGKVVLRDVALGSKLKPTQVLKLLPQLLSETELKITQGQTNSVVSLRGVSAVLLKMDDIQGRVLTPSALVKKGTSRRAVLPANPTPVVQAVAISATKPDDKNLFAALVDAVGKHDCLSEAGSFSISRLSATQMLVSREPCWAAPYNTGNKYWVVEDKPPHSAVLIDDDNLNEWSESTSTLYGGQKGRGIGDCLQKRSWVWNGNEFVFAEDVWTGLCKGFLGGAWELPLYVSRVISVKK